MNEENTLFSISDLLGRSFADFPKDVKPLNKREKKWILQRCVFDILKREDMRVVNKKRYREFLKEKKWRHNPQSMGAWLKSKDKKFKKMEAIPVDTFGVFTSKLSEDQFYRLQSECQDLLNRGESPNVYMWGIRSRKI